MENEVIFKILRPDDTMFSLRSSRLQLSTVRIEGFHIIAARLVDKHFIITQRQGPHSQRVGSKAISRRIESQSYQHNSQVAL